MTQKIKVGFHLVNEGYPNVDLRFPEKGNPGIGGTQFTTIATAYYLNKYFPDIVEPILLANNLELLPPSLKACYASNDIDAAVQSEALGCNIFVFKSHKGNHEIYDYLNKSNLKAIARSNNTPNVEGLYQIANCLQIKAHVCVGHEDLDRLRDHQIFAKSTRIFHPFNIENFVPKNEIVKQGNTVVFIGSIIPAKGFHYLARVWPDIIKERADAKLIVIGSGKLYDRNSKLGKWGVAEESYEANYIRPFLSDKNGNIIKSVHFAGLLGFEKIEILQNADIGVANPSGLTETFCSSALEFQACGTPVVSAAKGGLLDTVAHGKTGLLVKNDRELISSILYLLNNPAVAKQFGANGIDFVKNKFSPQENAKQWLNLFIDICNDKPPQQQPIKNNYFYRAKFLREGMRILKRDIPLLQNVPSLIEIKPLVKRLLR
ncbi:MAG: glycosyltransferase family 4 protein [Calothrix sp. MO_192.B10]|nr:glycosyltransferase family 4 protein [Calothrix sp. MO_192.B10]